MQEELPRWMGAIDPESGTPSYWAFWGFDYGGQRGVGNYYGANDFSLFSLSRSYLTVTGDWAWLARTVSQVCMC
jgi:hypothetical protein